MSKLCALAMPRCKSLTRVGLMLDMAVHALAYEWPDLGCSVFDNNMLLQPLTVGATMEVVLLGLTVGVDKLSDSLAKSDVSVVMIAGLTTGLVPATGDVSGALGHGVPT